jgi:hypothetical protein
VTSVKDSERTEELASRLRKLGAGINDGSVRMPDLLKELDEIDSNLGGESDDEI